PLPGEPRDRPVARPPEGSLPEVDQGRAAHDGAPHVPAPPRDGKLPAGRLRRSGRRQLVGRRGCVLPLRALRQRVRLLIGVVSSGPRGGRPGPTPERQSPRPAPPSWRLDPIAAATRLIELGAATRPITEEGILDPVAWSGGWDELAQFWRSCAEP